MKRENVSKLIKTATKVRPMIYAYTTPGVTYNEGFVKIGYTEQDVDRRIYQQTHTAGILATKHWDGDAIYLDGSGRTFRDTDFHAYLRRNNVERRSGTEWFRLSPDEARDLFEKFRLNRGSLTPRTADEITLYTLREEQAKAVSQTVAYRQAHEGGEFLWNAKPRFGKTLSAYELVKQLGAEKILIVTNRPAIANSWYEDYEKFLGRKGGYFFVSGSASLKGKPKVISYEEYAKDAKERKKVQAKRMGLIYFVSLQDLKGSAYLGGKIDKLRELGDITWDILIIDEAHEGVDTMKTERAFRYIKRRFTLHLSGTPFKALASEKFPADAIFNWTYADEQRMKESWEKANEQENPYEVLPKLNLFTYQISRIVDTDQGHDFDLNEFFATKGDRFVHDEAVDTFLEALTTQDRFPFSTPELRGMLKHTFWLLDRVKAVELLAKKLRAHPIFGDYEIVIAAGDGKLDEDEAIKASYDRVMSAIREHDKTITLSVGQLTTGVTIPELSGVLMLSNVGSPSLYMQAAFRAQNPCLYRGGENFYRKQNSYVFDFDPARTLTIFEQFANNLTQDAASDSASRVQELLKFFPVIGEDDNGEMIELTPEKVLSIPRILKANEIVNSGFMSDFLFQNVAGNVFHGSRELLDIITKLTPVSKPTINAEVTIEELQKIPLDEDGEISLSDDYVDGRASEVFGGKIFATPAADMTNDEEELKKFLKATAAEIIEAAKRNYGSNMKRPDETQLRRRLEHEAEKRVETVFKDREVEQRRGRDASEQKFQQTIQTVAQEFIEDAKDSTITTIETSIFETEKEEREAKVKDHLRGFSRTVPAFLMAYGDKDITLENFDKIAPDEVFKEVTSITLEEFRYLRDEGKFFAPTEFNNAVKEFMRRRDELADYFDERNTRDIFDYIPPQKTNQIFTPKRIVMEMIDMLEQENPGCFDDPDKTFVDPYMKSGLFIAEIVKRLYRSKRMKELYPDGMARLKHIFAEQVYGLAPTEITFNIAKNFLLGFDKNSAIKNFNLRQVDALPFARDGTLRSKLEELFGHRESL